MENIEEKQLYLRNNILEKGYNGEEFMEYLKGKKGEKEIDLNNWDFNDLKNVVEEFIFKYHSNSEGNIKEIDENGNKDINNIKEDNEIKNINENKDINENDNKDINENDNKDINNIKNDDNEIKIINEKDNNGNKNIDNNNIENINNNINQNIQNNEINKVEEQKIKEKKIEEEKKEQTENNPNTISKENKQEEKIKINPPIQKCICKKIENTIISELKNIKINLLEPQVVDGGFFSRKYVTYLIKTIPFEIKVRKRYSDFEWLRNILSIIYPNVTIPPMPKKNYGSRFNEEFINKRLRSLEKFLNGISIHPLLRNSQIFYDFLSIEKENEFNDKKNEYNKLKLPQNLYEHKTLTGDGDIYITNDKEEYLNNIRESCLINQVNLSQITKSYKNLIESINIVSEQMKNISNIWNEIGISSNKLNDDENIINVYFAFSKLMSDWSEMEKKTINILNIQIREYFRYIKNEFHSIEELVNKVDNYKKTFYKNCEYLNYKKNVLFESGNISYWGIKDTNILNNPEILKNKLYIFPKMLPNETKNVILEKDIYAFYLNSLISEYERIKNLNSLRHRKIIKKLSDELINNYSDFHVKMAECVLSQFKLDEMKNIEEINEQEIIDEYKKLKNKSEEEKKIEK